MFIFTTNLGVSGRWNLFHQLLQLSKNTNNLYTWALTSCSYHSFSPWSCVIKTKCLKHSALLWKCAKAFLSKITHLCKDDCILLYNYYYKNFTNPIFLGREWIWIQWLWKPFKCKYFDNIQPVNYCFCTPDPPTLFCLDGGNIHMDNVTLIWATRTGIFSNSAR